MAARAATGPRVLSGGGQALRGGTRVTLQVLAVIALGLAARAVASVLPLDVVALRARRVVVVNGAFDGVEGGCLCHGPKRALAGTSATILRVRSWSKHHRVNVLVHPLPRFGGQFG